MSQTGCIFLEIRTNVKQKQKTDSESHMLPVYAQNRNDANYARLLWGAVHGTGNTAISAMLPQSCRRSKTSPANTVATSKCLPREYLESLRAHTKNARAIRTNLWQKRPCTSPHHLPWEIQNRCMRHCPKQTARLDLARLVRCMSKLSKPSNGDVLKKLHGLIS